MKFISLKSLLLLFIIGLVIYPMTHAGTVTGDLSVWHPITVTFDGPETSETYPSTFLDNCLTVTFTHGDTEYVVPGYFAADGRAGMTHATAGNQWRVHFTPDRTGEWKYSAEFVTGNGVAINDQKGTAYDLPGSSGTFVIEESDVDPESPDFRGRGRLEYVGKHHMRFAGTGEYFLKGGMGSPENFLAFDGFDGTWDAEQRPGFPALGAMQLHHYGPHRDDWKMGDPFWENEKGRDGIGIIGLLNYVSGQGLNSMYLMPLTYEGDGCDVWPWTNPENRETFDVSKLDQWGIVLSYMQEKGIHIHMLLTETENENLFELMDGPSLFADTRKLYYREMVARFAHLPGLSWNLGEESGWDDDKGLEIGKGNTHEQRRLFMTYIDKLDAYDHPMKIHEIEIVEIYPQLVGYRHFDGPALQRHKDYNKVVREHIEMSEKGGHPWLVSMDEPLGATYGLPPDADDPSHDKPRKEVLWATYMAGGSGVEWYFGWQNNSPTSDLSAEDMRVREAMWRQTRIAREFFETYIPFQDMKAMNELVEGDSDYVFALENDTYLVYLKNGGTASLDLIDADGVFNVRWFDPRDGGGLQDGSVKKVSGGGIVTLGNPPMDANQDWAVLISR